MINRFNKTSLIFFSITCITVLFGNTLFSSAVSPIGNASFTLEKKTSGYQADYDAKSFIKSYSEIVLKSYQAAYEESLSLQKAINNFLAKPSEETLYKARLAYKEGRKYYLRTEAFRFYEGPIDFGKDFKGKGIFSSNYKEGPETRINAWPLNESFIDYVKGRPNSGLINETNITISRKTILEQDQVTDEADVSTGWHAIEFLLWGQDFYADGPGQRPYTDYTTAKNHERRAQYLKLVTDLLVDDLKWLPTNWEANRDNYRKWFESLNQAEVMGRVLTSLASLAALELGGERLGVAMDSFDQENEQSCFSDLTHFDFIYDFQGIMNIYYGMAKNYSGVGLQSLLRESAPKLEEQINQTILHTASLISEIPAPFDQMIIKLSGSKEKKIGEDVYNNLIHLGQLFQKTGALFGVNVVLPTE